MNRERDIRKSALETVKAQASEETIHRVFEFTFHAGFEKFRVEDKKETLCVEHAFSDSLRWTPASVQTM